ncbi:hypothetical protein GQ54DRAFT_299328 [Martensiomyces pterosporus]|nr:hypothetical protein GQ54DRAFT_299328 [Martensiomyces pterosporus]
MGYISGYKSHCTTLDRGYCESRAYKSPCTGPWGYAPSISPFLHIPHFGKRQIARMKHWHPAAALALSLASLASAEYDGHYYLHQQHEHCHQGARHGRYHKRQQGQSGFPGSNIGGNAVLPGGDNGGIPDGNLEGGSGQSALPPPKSQPPQQQQAAGGVGTTQPDPNPANGNGGSSRATQTIPSTIFDDLPGFLGINLAPQQHQQTQAPKAQPSSSVPSPSPTPALAESKADVQGSNDKTALSLHSSVSSAAAASAATSGHLRALVGAIAAILVACDVSGAI